MNEGNAKFARNNREIARALGIKLPRQRRKLEAKLHEIIEITRHPEFPPREKKRGWPVLALQRFAIDFAAAIVDDKLRRAAVADILNNDDPNKRSVDLVKSSVSSPNGSLPIAQSANGLTEIAHILAQHFKVDCRKQYVDRWRKGESIPRGAPVFPPPDPKSNRFIVADCLAWYEKWVLPGQNGNNQTPSLFANLTQERDRNELEEIEHQRWLREAERKADDKNYVRRDVMDSIILDCAKGVSRLATDAFEKTLPTLFKEKLAEAGLATDKIMELHRSACAQANDQFQSLAAGAVPPGDNS